MNTVRAVLGFVASVVALYFGLSAAWLLGNHLFDWSPDKVSVEWSATLLFVGLGLLISVVAAGFALVALRGRARMIVSVLLGTEAAICYVLLNLKVWRVEPAFLWLTIALPVLFIAAIWRFRHARAT